MKKLKIIFVTLINDVKDPSLGFIVKDISKAEALNDLENVECLGVSFSSSILEDYYYSKSFFVKKIKPLKNKFFFNTFYEGRYLYRQVDSFLAEKECDIILFRYNIASRSLFKLVKKYKGKFVFEHNTSENTEHALIINERFRKFPFSFKPGFFIYHFEGRIWPLFCERYYGNKIRNIALAGISVTKEIAMHQTNRVKTYVNTVITNGVKYDPHIEFAPKKLENKINAFILLGTGADWHGVDRIIEGIAKYNGSYDIYLDVIGYTSADDESMVHKYGLQDRIKFLPPVTNRELVGILKKYHVSFGTLGLHRKKLTEASPLKVRESLMRGFPVVIGYHDTDISNVDKLKEFVLQIPANDDPVDFNKVIEFTNAIMQKDNYQAYISSVSKPYIDYAVKADQIADFLKNMLNR